MYKTTAQSGVNKTSTKRAGFVGCTTYCMRKGSLLIEVMLAVVIFGLFMTATYTTLITGQEGTRNGSQRIRGVNYTLQGLEVVRSIASQDDGYDLLVPGIHGFTIDPNSGIWTLTGSDIERYGYRTIINIADLSTTSKKIDITSNWGFGIFRSGETTVSTVITNWQDSPGVGDWSSITQTGSWTAGRQRNYTDAYAYGGYLFLTNEAATYGKGLTILDISDATNPTEVSTSFNIPFNTYTPVAYKNILYMAVNSVQDVRGYSIADPTALNGGTFPVATATLPGGGSRARSVAAADGVLYVGADGTTGEEFFSFSTETGSMLTPLDDISLPGNPTITDITLKGDYAYLAGESATLFIVDISDPTNLLLLNTRLMGYQQATGVRTHGTGFYMSMLNGLDEVGMRTGTGTGIPDGSISNLTGINVSGNANDLDIDPLGCYAFLATGDGLRELQVRDATQTTLPEETSVNINNTGQGRAVEYNVLNDELYVATESGVYLYTPSTGGRCGDGIVTAASSTYSCPTGYTWDPGSSQCVIGPITSAASVSSSSAPPSPIVVTVTGNSGSEDGGTLTAFNSPFLARAVAIPGGSDASFTFTASSITPSDLTVNYSIGGTATNDEDYALLNGTAVISSGTTSETIIIGINDDDLVEKDETVIITITGVSYGSIGSPSTLTATLDAGGDNDFTDGQVVASAHTDPAEPSTNGSFTLSLTNGKSAGSDMTINYSITGTATAGVDYTALSGTAVISEGNSSTVISIPVLDESDDDDGETITLTITTGSDYTIGVDSSETATIGDNDSNPTSPTSPTSPSAPSSPSAPPPTGP